MVRNWSCLGHHRLVSSELQPGLSSWIKRCIRYLGFYEQNHFSLWWVGLLLASAGGLGFCFFWFFFLKSFVVCICAGIISMRMVHDIIYVVSMVSANGRIYVVWCFYSWGWLDLGPSGGKWSSRLTRSVFKINCPSFLKRMRKCYLELGCVSEIALSSGSWWWFHMDHTIRWKFYNKLGPLERGPILLKGFLTGIPCVGFVYHGKISSLNSSAFGHGVSVPRDSWRRSFP